MSWMRERDALIAQTLAFVQTITGRRPELGQRDAGAAAPTSEAAPAPAMTADDASGAPAAELPQGPASAAPEGSSPASPKRQVPSFQAEVAARVATFRQHQERFNREREAYFSATIARTKRPPAERPSPRADK